MKLILLLVMLFFLDIGPSFLLLVSFLLSSITFYIRCVCMPLLYIAIALGFSHSHSKYNSPFRLMSSLVSMTWNFITVSTFGAAFNHAHRFQQRWSR